MFHHGCIAPHFFQLVKLPGFGQHNMNNYIDVINQDQLLTLPAFVFVSCLKTFLFYIGFYKIGNSP